MFTLSRCNFIQARKCILLCYINIKYKVIECILNRTEPNFNTKLTFSNYR